MYLPYWSDVTLTHNVVKSAGWAYACDIKGRPDELTAEEGKTLYFSDKRAELHPVYFGYATALSEETTPIVGVEFGRMNIWWYRCQQDTIALDSITPFQTDGILQFVTVVEFARDITTHDVSITYVHFPSGAKVKRGISETSQTTFPPLKLKELYYCLNVGNYVPFFKQDVLWLASGGYYEFEVSDLGANIPKVKIGFPSPGYNGRFGRANELYEHKIGYGFDHGFHSSCDPEYGCDYTENAEVATIGSDSNTYHIRARYTLNGAGSKKPDGYPVSDQKEREIVSCQEGKLDEGVLDTKALSIKKA
jgi:hypothetical protein